LLEETVRRLPYTRRLIIALLFPFLLLILPVLTGGLHRLHEITLGPRLGYICWISFDSIGIQRHEWLGPPKPIMLSRGIVAQPRQIIWPSTSNLWNHSKWEDGSIDRNVTPELFTPVGHVTEEWWVSYWLVLLTLLSPCLYYAVRWLGGWAQPRITKSKLCPNCRYDLRAHKPGDKCPECGTLIPGK
jgi:hypothetical protein